jgi:phosphatidylglycerol---prolipoprotein diacylglyceryl transferase
MDFIFQSPGPILLNYGPFTIRWYGLLTATAFLVGLSVATKVLKDRKSIFKEAEKITVDELSNFAIVAILTGLVGARAWFVILQREYFWQHPLESFQIWLGGQSIQGGLLGAAIGTWLYLWFKYRKLPVGFAAHYTELLACLALVAPLGQAIGRWGNFFNEEAFGSVTDLPWKLYISHTGQFHHPTFLYEMFWNLILFGLLYGLRLKLKSNQIIGLYLMGYSLGRLMIEPLRTDSLMLWGVEAASLVAVFTVIFGFLLIYTKKT